MGDFWTTRDTWDNFSLAEIVDLESMYKAVGEVSLGREICQGLATKFSLAPYRDARPEITWHQVQSWFQDRHTAEKAKVESSLAPVKLIVDLCGESISTKAPKTPQKPKSNRLSEFKDLQFEARSFKDYAWYDVASFLTYRVTHNGELEVRVRFSGYSNTDDEWVNVKQAVRDRSIPLEPSECHKVNTGDLVLCFQEREYRAVYCDAHVVEIERRIHDSTSCDCVFLIRYDHDNVEEEVQLGRLCCRPKQSPKAVTVGASMARDLWISEVLRQPCISKPVNQDNLSYPL